MEGLSIFHNRSKSEFGFSNELHLLRIKDVNFWPSVMKATGTVYDHDKGLIGLQQSEWKKVENYNKLINQNTIFKRTEDH